MTKTPTPFSIPCATLALVALVGCGASTPPDGSDPNPALPASTHSVVSSSRGTPSDFETMEAVLDRPGPLTVETVRSARWEAPRSGLINLAHPRAASLEDGPEPIDVYFHAITHPSAGLYVVDTGAATALSAEDHPMRTSSLGQAFNLPALDVATPLGAWLGERPLRAVFLTHLHFDHVLGLPDVAPDVPIFVGPGEAALESPYHAMTQPAVDGLLEGRPPMDVWSFRGSDVLDVFGDASLFVLRTPGHTPGSVSFVARTEQGPVLITGDACHTRWGWEHDVEPGTFSHDGAQNRESLARLRALAARHPAMDVRLGHQSLR
jgi:N-acyl homoserine lactone hydrolase